MLFCFVLVGIPCLLLLGGLLLVFDEMWTSGVDKFLLAL